MERKEHIEHLLRQYIDGKYTAGEYTQLLDYFAIDAHSEEAKELLYKAISRHSYVQELSDETITKITDNAHTRVKKRIQQKQESSLWIRLLPYAAVILLGITAYQGWRYYLQQRQYAPQLHSQYGDDVQPGSNKAYITLANGQKLELNDSQEGITIDQNGIRYADGKEISSTAHVPFAQIHVPNAGQYRLTLPDGSKVILNSASSLRYPTKFTEQERRVRLTGEAYFEIAPNKAQPFVVESAHQAITVLGTHFNVQAYPDEATETTLLEGKVSVQSYNPSQQPISLQAGQQSRLSAGRIGVAEVDAEEYIAWANNTFYFNNLELSQIFKQLERWYDVEITYPPSMANQKYLIKTEKNRKLSEVLTSIARSIPMQFTIQGRRVTVQK